VHRKQTSIEKEKRPIVQWCERTENRSHKKVLRRFFLYLKRKTPKTLIRYITEGDGYFNSDSQLIDSKIGRKKTAVDVKSHRFKTTSNPEMEKPKEGRPTMHRSHW